MNTDFPPVFVGKTDYPLRSDPSLRGNVDPFDVPHGEPARLLDGPPYANGLPHLGHVLNKHLKDAVARALTAQNHPVDWRAGWDCHGLPLELAVEKLGADRSDRLGFLAQARQFAQTQVDGQREVFEQQGWQADWHNSWKTMDPGMEAGTLRVFAQMVERGVVKVRQATVPWCAACQSTLSMAEQEEKSVQVQTWLASFALEDGTYLLSWTTTPWTLPLNQGLVVCPSARYVLLEKAGQRAWVSEDTAEKWARTLEAVVLEQTCQGVDLEGQAYRTPWTQGVVKASEAVLAQAGTGVLHAVPGLAALDTQLGEMFGWEVHDFLSVDGRVENSPCQAQNGLRAGSSIDEVRHAYEGWPFVHTVEMAQSLPHCWRHKKPLLTRPSRQVFVALDPAMRQKVAGWVQSMEFTPETGRARLKAAVEGRPDWCVSRQRTWGVPLALYLDPKTGGVHSKAAMWMRKVADAMEHEGVEAWWNSPDSRWVDEPALRVDDVLDVWFDSGCVPALLGQADVVVEGVDQFRGWFQSCLWVAAALGWEEPPFKRVVAHGFVVDEQGRKLSKSTGGDKAGKAPVWHSLPTDVVRAWALSGAEGGEKAWSQDTVREATAVVARWRGLLRFMCANLLPTPGQGPLEEWDHYWWWKSQSSAEQAVQLCSQGYTGQAMNLARELADTFSAVALGSWKDRLYCAPEHTTERRALDQVLRGCLEAWAKMLGVLAPRMVRELLEHGSWMDPGPVECPSQKSMERVHRVLAVRQQLAGEAEKLGQQKVGPGRRCVYWDKSPDWPGQMVADALDVAQVFDGPLCMEESPDPVCPRCRRAQRQWVGQVCRPCWNRCGD